MINKAYAKLFAFIFFILGTGFYYTTCYLFAETAVDDLLVDKENVKITMDLQNAQLKDVLKMLSVQSGLNFIASEAVAERELTLYLDNVELKDAMDKIFKANNLSYDLDEENRIFIVKDWGKPEIELDTRIYFLKYIRVGNSRLNEGVSSSSGGSSSGGGSSSSSGGSSSGSGSNGLKDSLSAIISKDGKIIEDPATNSIVITDMPNKFKIIEQIIAKLDVPIPQVMIEVEILDVDKSDVDRLGIKFSSSSTQGIFSYTGPNLGGTYFPFVSDTFRKAGAKTAPTPGSWTMQGFGFIADFLSTRSSTKFLARPRLFVLNNETAELKLSSNEAIGSTTTTQGQGAASTTSTAAERAETGVTFLVTPQVSMATGEITMVLQPKIKEAVNGLTIGSQQTKDVEERSVTSTIRVKDGETVMLGGLIRKKNPLTITKFPFFADIPIVGIFFRHKDTTGTKDREIIVFITPKIVKSQAQMFTANPSTRKILGERQQDSFISAERKEIIAQSLGTYEAAKNLAN